jgi:hypothetical protein
LPTFMTAKQIAENALKIIGAFPSTMTQADAGDLSTALTWLEMIMNTQAGIRPMAGFWDILEIPLQADIGDYNLTDYGGDAFIQEVFSASLVDSSGNTTPLELVFESDAVIENLSERGPPSRAIVTRDILPVMKLYPAPAQSNEDAGQIVRVRYQSYHSAINPSGTGQVDVKLRPAWYMWAIKKLAYELGCGPVRRLPEGELQRLDKDSLVLEMDLMARDGKYNKKPLISEPVAGSDHSWRV